MDIKKNIDLKKWNSWKVGGVADFFCQPHTEEEIIYSFQWAEKHSKPVSFLSGGTNVLISDQGVKGLLINLQNLKTVRHWKSKDRVHIVALAGAPKSELMKIFLQYKLSPALFLCGLPGHVGGGVVMNAGARQNIAPKEFGEIVDWIKVIQKQGQIKKIKKEQIAWKYRSSQGWEPGLIYEVGISWPLQSDIHLPDKLKEVALKRSRSQPLGSSSCGSVFKNPQTGDGAGALIEKSGLKGYQIGQACVSKKHANFIINLGEAKAMDIHRLIQFIQEKVQNSFGICLEPEVKYLGQWNI